MPYPEESYRELKEACDHYGTTLVVVSKTRTEKEIRSIYDLGQRVFAENRAHELIIKASLLPSDIEWHLIGHLQTNKVKSVLPYVSCIQSLDSLKLWHKLQAEAKDTVKQVDCLLQIKVAVEDTKYGWAIDELEQTLKTGIHQNPSNIIISGIMGMASLTTDTEQVEEEMRQLKTYFDYLKLNYFKEDDRFKIRSMGMSGDYKIALEAGSNMIRIGSLLFE